MSETEKFLIEGNAIRNIMRKSLGQDYEVYMAKTAIQIVEYQYRVNLESSLIAGIEICKAMKKEGYPVDRIKAASVWWECNKLYFCTALYDLMDEN